LCGRDNARTPIQWDDSENSGFTSGKPWLKVNPNYKEVNVAAQENDPNSELNYFRKMIKLRSDNLTLIYGQYELLAPDDTQLYAYTRSLDADKLLVLLNFSETKLSFKIPSEFNNAEVLINNINELSFSGVLVELHAYQAVILRKRD
jgi:glycosidase